MKSAFEERICEAAAKLALGNATPEQQRAICHELHRLAPEVGRMEWNYNETCARAAQDDMRHVIDMPPGVN